MITEINDYNETIITERRALIYIFICMSFPLSLLLYLFSLFLTSHQEIPSLTRFLLLLCYVIQYKTSLHIFLFINSLSSLYVKSLYAISVSFYNL